MNDVQSLIKKTVRELKPYQVENIPCRIKLDAMENPYPLPESLMKEIVKGMEKIKINRYPDSSASRLKNIISSQVGISSDNIIIGNGSDELIQLILTAFGECGDRVLFPVPTFSMYGIIARSLSLVPEGVPLDENWEIPLDKFLSAIERVKPKVIFISYPNNPTGNCFSKEGILKILEMSECIVVIDEAYYDFSRKTFLPPPKSPTLEGGGWEGRKNLIILRTLSKIGMAGLRVGYLMADREICRELNKVRLPYNSNTISQEIAGIILENRFEIQRQIDAIISERKRLMTCLKQIPNITPFPSETNFILFKTAKDSKEVFDRLLSNGILVRNFGDDIYLKDFLRVTVGTREENDEFLRVIKLVDTGK
ncbi:MAG: histidinol-phosphate transaminase [Nitrospinae bacterium RIFCSPHIGHO2_02_39_11]|nr:MAG: histidinol-phosphate transaminase [Nitrospinae bacterium RIFCSPHIGHO2_02_39_11]